MRRGRNRRHRLGQARAGRRRRSRSSSRGRRRGATCKRRPAMRAKRRSIGNLLAAFLTEHRSTFRGLAFIRAKSKTLSRHRCCATLGESATPHACPAPGPPCGKPVHTNMGHMAHLSRLPGSANWGISISKEPVGAWPRNGHKPRTEVSPHHTQRHPPQTKTTPRRPAAPRCHQETRRTPP